MLKIAIGLLGALLALVVAMHGFGPRLHGQGSNDLGLFEAMHDQATTQAPPEDEGLTFSMAQNDDFYLCNDPFFEGIYEVIVETYADGVDNVTEEGLSGAIFGFIRNWTPLSVEEREGWVAHIQLIPGQLIEIVREDPAVVANCDNFSVAILGPP